jgi:hypothetical protein
LYPFEREINNQPLLFAAFADFGEKSGGAMCLSPPTALFPEKFTVCCASFIFLRANLLLISSVLFTGDVIESVPISRIALPSFLVTRINSFLVSRVAQTPHFPYAFDVTL